MPASHDDLPAAPPPPAATEPPRPFTRDDDDEVVARLGPEHLRWPTIAVREARRRALAEMLEGRE